MIVITGASGQLGRLVIEELLKSVPANQLVAAVRTPEKVDDLAKLGVVVRKADYNDLHLLQKAFAGADKVLLISSSEIGQRAQQHANAIEAAKNAGVQLIAYTSILHADTTPLSLGEEHKKTENLLKKAGIPHVLLRNGWYTENYTSGITYALQSGVVMDCAGNGKISSAARADFAAAAAAVLITDNQADKVYELAGDEAFTLNDFAAELSRQSGKTIKYNNVTEAEYATALKNAGLPEVLATLLADSGTGASEGGLFDSSKTLSKLINRPTTSLSEVIKQALNK
jgi:NAD(P)H dehydrogenase (quinone)